MSVDLSQGLVPVLTFVKDALRAVVRTLSSIYILPGVSLLGLLVALACLGIIISSIFVIYDGGIDDED